MHRALGRFEADGFRVVLFVLGAIVFGNMEGSDINWVQLCMQLLGGLALFLFGMEVLTGSLRAAAGNQLKKLLGKATKNRFVALFSGAIVTAAAQSSSVTTVLLVGFCSVGLLSLKSSVGVILGANLGSTATAQIIAFDVTQWGLLLVACGFALRLMKGHEVVRNVGGLVMGLGLIFFGMELMSEATNPLREYQPFVDLMAEMTNPVWGILCGILFTAVVQSSAATTGLTIVLAAEGLLGLEGAVAIVLGSNIGTCVTALMAAVGQPKEALRVGLIHVIFNVGGVILWLPFLSILSESAIWMTDWFGGAGGGDNLDVGRAVANAHTIFNFVNAFLFLGFAGVLVKVVEKIVPVRDEEDEEVVNRYLDNYYLSEPATALGQVSAECVDFLKSVASLHAEMSEAVYRRDKDVLDRLEGVDDKIDARQEDFLRFLGSLSEKQLTGPQQLQLNAYVGIVNEIENLGDILDHVLRGLGLDLLSLGSEISSETVQLLEGLTEEVQRDFEKTQKVLEDFSRESANEVFAVESRVRDLVREAKDDLTSRLANRDDERLQVFRIEIDLVECHARIAHILNEIVREVP